MEMSPKREREKELTRSMDIFDGKSDALDEIKNIINKLSDDPSKVRAIILLEDTSVKDHSDSITDRNISTLGNKVAIYCRGKEIYTEIQFNDRAIKPHTKYFPFSVILDINSLYEIYGGQ